MGKRDATGMLDELRLRDLLLGNESGGKGGKKSLKETAISSARLSRKN